MPWDEWEDFDAGLYGTDMDPERIRMASALLSDPEQFRETAREMLREWSSAAYQNLVNHKTGHNAWIGQATCCYSVGATSADTRYAWGTLSNARQMIANGVATSVRLEWERARGDVQAVLDL